MVRCLSPAVCPPSTGCTQAAVSVAYIILPASLREGHRAHVCRPISQMRSLRPGARLGSIRVEPTAQLRLRHPTPLTKHAQPRPGSCPYSLAVPRAVPRERDTEGGCGTTHPAPCLPPPSKQACPQEPARAPCHTRPCRFQAADLSCSVPRFLHLYNRHNGRSQRQNLAWHTGSSQAMALSMAAALTAPALGALPWHRPSPRIPGLLSEPLPLH